MSNKVHRRTKPPTKSTKSYDVEDIDDITEEIELTLSALRMQMATSDARDPEAVQDVRGKLDNLVEKLAKAAGKEDARSKKGILAQLGKRLFSTPPIIDRLAADNDDK